MKRTLIAASLATVLAAPLAAGTTEDVIIEPDVIEAAAPQSSGNGAGIAAVMTLLMIAAMVQ